MPPKPKAPDARIKASECPRAHFHRPGVYCKWCERLFPAKGKE